MIFMKKVTFCKSCKGFGLTGNPVRDFSLQKNPVRDFSLQDYFLGAGGVFLCLLHFLCPSHFVFLNSHNHPKNIKIFNVQ